SGGPVHVVPVTAATHPNRTPQSPANRKHWRRFIMKPCSSFARSSGSSFVAVLALASAAGCDEAARSDRAATAGSADRTGGAGGGTAPAVSADCTSGAVVLTSPANGATVAGDVTVSVTLTAGVRAIVRVDTDPKPLATLTGPYAFTWDSREVADGKHTLWVTC